MLTGSFASEETGNTPVYSPIAGKHRRYKLSSPHEKRPDFENSKSSAGGIGVQSPSEGPEDNGVKVYKVITHLVKQDRSEVVSRVGSLIYTEQLTDYLWGSAQIWWRRATNK